MESKLLGIKLEWLTRNSNRSNNQTQMLYELVDQDFNKLLELEMQIANCFCGYCPGDKEEVKKILKLEAKSDKLQLMIKDLEMYAVCQAVYEDDLDEACLLVQDAINQKDGDVAGLYFMSHFDNAHISWKKFNRLQRANTLLNYLKCEKTYEKLILN